MTDESAWPQWLKNADTKNADVSITPSGRVIWNDGVWRGGVWHDGVWNGGVWLGGVWLNGEWCGGEWCGGWWHNGMWYSGVWYNGWWLAGVWHNGKWLGGSWRSGFSAPSRAYYEPVVDVDAGLIQFGCMTKTPEYWNAVIAGNEKCKEAPERGTEEWRLMVASFRAAEAYLSAMKETEND